MEEVGEGEGGAEKGFSKFRRHLDVVKLVKVAKKIKVVRVVPLVKMSKTF